MTDEIVLNLVKLGQTIRTFRLGLGWSQGDLAEKSGVSKPYISDLENGSAGKPNIQYVFSIATALGRTMDELLSESKPSTLQRTKIPKRDLPPGLAELQKDTDLSDADVEMLAHINFRGHRPRDKEGWRFLLEALRMLSQKSS